MSTIIHITRSLQSKNKQIEKEDINTWSDKDLLIYFLKRYKVLTKHGFFMPKESWKVMIFRIKEFKIKMGLENKLYKKFIDNVFDIFFTQENYIPTFGSIVSKKVYYITEKLLRNRHCSNAEFEQLKNQLYSSDLFKKLM